MKGCRLFASALRFQAFICLGAFTGGMSVLAADQVPALTVVSEDIPKAAQDLQKMISTLGLNVAPCSASDPVGADPLICSDPVKAICGSQGADERTQREQLIEFFKKRFLAKVLNQIQLKLNKEPNSHSQDQVQSEGQAQTQLQVERELEAMADNLEIIEKLLFELLKDRGWSKESVEKLFERAKAIELSKIRPDDTIHPNRVKALTSAPWLTSEVIRKLPIDQRERARKAIVTACGVNALSSDAFATILSETSEAETDIGMALDAGKSAAFIICPGLILQTALSDLGPESLAYPVGHELGHILQPLSQVQGTRKIDSPGDKRKLVEAEKSYERAIKEAEVACPKLKGCFVRKGLFSDDLYLNSCDVDRTIRQCGADSEAIRKKVLLIQVAAKARQTMIAQLTSPPGDTDRDRAYLSCLKMNDLNEMNSALEQVAAFEKLNEAEAKNSLLTRLSVSQYADFKKHELAEFERKWGRKPDSIDLHQSELVADYWGGQVLGKILKDMPDGESRKAFLISNFTALCQSGITQSKETDIEIHPPAGYRIQRILSNPAIRFSLGCKSPPPRVWCER